MIIELKYGNTNTYLIKGKEKYILFDTDWAGTFERFCQAIKSIGIQIQDIEYLFLSHFHPDHMGIGMKYEGILRQFGKNNQGIVDCARYSMIKAER